MTEITINDVKYTNVPNKKAGTKFASALTQSNIGISQSVADYMNSAYFYTLVNAVDINWNGIEVAANSYINTTSDLIKFILSVSNVDLSDYATMSYVQEALSGKANVNDVYTKTEVDNLIPDPVDLSSYATKEEIPDLSSYVSYTTANSYYITLDTNQTITGVKTLTNFLYMNLDEGNLKFNSSNVTTLGDIYTKYKWKYYGSSRMNLMRIKTYSSTYLALSNGGISLLMPMASNISSANIPSFDGEIYMPLGFKDSNNNIITASYNGLVDLSSIGGGGTADLSNYVSYTQANSYYITVEGSKQIIYGSKTFIGDKKINFRQGTPANKLGFTLYDINEKEVGGLEWRPDTIGGRSLLSLQQYIGTGSKFEGVEMGYLGFRLTEKTNGKYNLITPLPSYVNTIETINVGNDYRNFFFPLVFKNGNNKVYTECTGLVDLSSLIPSVPDLSGYVSYTQANSYYAAKNDIPTMPDMSSYVSITSYNALAARVEELASWIVSYHSSYTPTTTDPDIYFDDPELTLDYQLNPEKLNGNRKTQSLRGGNNDDSDYITWSTSDSVIATVQGNGYVIAHRNGTVNVIVNYAAHDNYNSKTVQYQLTITNYKLYSTGQWYNNGDPAGSIEVIQGGSSSYTLTFTGTPSDSWAFSIDSAVSGISLDTTTGTITIDESQLNTTGTFNITANRPTDTSYYEGSAQTVIIITSSTTPIDPDIYFMSPTLTVDYNMEPNKLNGTEVTQALSGNDTSSTAWIGWSTDNSAIATVNHGGYVIAQGNGTVNIIAEYAAHDNYNYKKVQYNLTITNYSSGGGKTTPYAHWYENGTELSELVLVQGGSGTRTLTFSATPSDSWSFMDPMFSGISLDTTTGTITITESDLNVGNTSISANRSEDSSYYYGTANLNIRVLPTGSDTKFYYEQESVNLDNQGMTTASPMLHDEYVGLGYTKTYTSADTNVATVDAYGMISFVGAGDTTITATTTNGTDTHTATINVYCSVNKQYPSVSFEYNGTPYSGGTLPVVAPFTGTIQLTNITPADGWVITDPMIQGITILQNVIEVQNLSQGTYYINVNRPEDSEYYSGMSSLTLRVLPTGTNPNFYYEQESVNLDNQAMTTSSPMLYNNTGFAAIPTYQSADTTIATVDEYGMISFVGGGTTTVTASITNGTDTYTTSITVNCNVMNA